MSDGLSEKGVMKTSGLTPELMPNSGVGTEIWRKFVLGAQAARRWKVIIFSIIVTSLVVGAVITLLMSSQFTATSRIEVGRASTTPTAGQSAGFYNTQLQLLQAKSLAVSVAREMKLARADNFFLAHGVSPPERAAMLDAGQGPRIAASPFDERERLAVDLLEKNIEIIPVRDSLLVDVQYTSRSPIWSAAVANIWVRQFVDANMDRRSAGTAGARHFLEKRLADLRGRIAQSERNAALYASMAGIIPLSGAAGRDAGGDTDQTLASRDMSTLNDAFHRAMVRRAAAESQTGAGGQGAVAPAFGGQTLAILRARRAEVASEYARLSVQFKPAYPALVALAQQRRVLDDSISREEKRVATTLATDAENATRLEHRLRKEVTQSKSRLDRQSLDSVQYNIYRREADTDRQLYDGFLQRYKQLNVADIGATDVSVVDRAELPNKPSSPRLWNNMALALIAGVLIATGVTAALERGDDSVGKPADIEDLGIPLIGVTQHVQEDNVQELLSDPKSGLSQAYQKIQSRLTASTSDGAPRSLMVTSSREGEGKSTTSLALASALARTGKRVVLVDADMHRPALHIYLGAQNEAGLSNLLAGDEDWHSSLQPLDGSGFTFLPAGQVPPSAAGLLSGDRMQGLIGELSHAFDYVILDAPPVLGLEDALLLSRSVENVMFVIEAGGAGKRTIRLALERLKGAEASVAGAIMTKTGEPISHYRYDKS